MNDPTVQITFAALKADGGVGYCWAIQHSSRSASDRKLRKNWTVAKSAMRSGNPADRISPIYQCHGYRCAATIR